MPEAAILPRSQNMASTISFVDRLVDLAAIFDDEINIAVLRRVPSKAIMDDCERFAVTPGLNLKLVVGANMAGRDALQGAIASGGASALVDDIFHWVDLIAEVTGATSVGVRLMTHTQAMCPRLHTDNVSLRLVTTYKGPGTQFVSQHLVQRSKLGHGSGGLSDEESGVVLGAGGIHTAQAGDVVLLKGEAWPNNSGRGAVHRSPSLQAGETRVVLTLDAL